MFSCSDCGALCSNAKGATRCSGCAAKLGDEVWGIEMYAYPKLTGGIEDLQLPENLVLLCDLSRIEAHGGYPCDWTWMGDTLVVASVDHKEAPELLIYSREYLEEWRRRAIKMMIEEDPDYDSISCAIESACDMPDDTTAIDPIEFNGAN